MGCIELMNYTVLLSDISFKEGREFIKRKFKEVYEVKPGYKLFDIYLIGTPPILIGVEDDYIIFPYVKPCHGTFVLKINSTSETMKFRTTNTPSFRRY